MPRKRRPSETPAQAQARVDIAKSQDRTRIIMTAIPWAGLGVIFWFLYRSVAVLAGQHTFADIGIHVLGDIRVTEGLAWALATGFGAITYRERKLRRDVIESLGTRNSVLERGIDPGRTSSKLTPRGETNPRDTL